MNEGKYQLQLEVRLEKSSSIRDYIVALFDFVHICLRIVIFMAGAFVILGVGLLHNLVSWPFGEYKKFRRF